MDRRKRNIFASAALLVAMALPVGVSAQTTLTADSWFTFSWSGLGSILQQFTATTSTIILTDAFVAGDMFELFQGATSLGQTSSVSSADVAPGGTVTGPLRCTSAECALASPWYSHRFYSVTVGAVYSLVTTQLADCCSGGAAYIQSTTRSVPEPSSVLLIMAGLMGIGLVARRRGIETWSS